MRPLCALTRPGKLRERSDHRVSETSCFSRFTTIDQPRHFIATYSNHLVHAPSWLTTQGELLPFTLALAPWSPQHAHTTLYSVKKEQTGEDVSTAILRPKRSPNRLTVDDAQSDDSSVATISAATMDTLGLFRGDTVIVRGKKRRDTGALDLPFSFLAAQSNRAVLIVLSSDDVEEGKILLNKGAL